MGELVELANYAVHTLRDTRFTVAVLCVARARPENGHGEGEADGATGGSVVSRPVGTFIVLVFAVWYFGN